MPSRYGPDHMVGLHVERRAFRFRVYPTDSQQVLLRRTFGCVRVVWNRSLRYRTDAWFERKERVNYNASSALLTTWKREPEYGWLNEVSAVPLQQCLRHQQAAFANFNSRGSAAFNPACF